MAGAPDTEAAQISGQDFVCRTGQCPHCQQQVTELEPGTVVHAGTHDPRCQLYATLPEPTGGA